MKKVAILLVFLLSLCACSDISSQRGRTVATLPGAAGTAMPREVVLAVSENADRYIIDAAEGFCRKANSLLRNSFTLTVSEVSGNPVSALNSGAAQFILLDGADAASVHPFFSITSECFRYDSYENFSMSCNRAPVLERLSAVSGAKVLASYYTGSNVLASQSQVDAMLATVQKQGDLPADDIRLYCLSGLSMSHVPPLEGLAASTLPETALRIEALSDPDVIVELSIPELVAFEPVEALPEVIGESVTDVTLTRSFHNIEPMWLIAAQPFYSNLTDSERAGITEAAAVMTSLIDSVCLDREELQLGAILEKDVTISSGFAATRAKLLRSRQERLAGISPEEKSFRALLDKIQ